MSMLPVAVTPTNDHALCRRFFFFNDPAASEIYTLSLHDRSSDLVELECAVFLLWYSRIGRRSGLRDRKSTRLNSSHVSISYAVFCLKKKTSRSPLGRVYPPLTTPKMFPSHMSFVTGQIAPM